MQASDADSKPITAVKGNPNIREIGKAYRITPERSRLMLQKQRELKAERENKLASIPQSQPLPPDTTTKRVQEINAQIDSVTEKFSKAKEPRDMQALAMSLDRLYGIWSLLTGHPRPGVRKDKPRRSVQTFATPLE